MVDGQKWTYGNADPFVSYLSSRPPQLSPSSHSAGSSLYAQPVGKKLWPQGVTRSQVLSDAANPPKVNAMAKAADPAVDPFAGFMNLRPHVKDNTAMQKALCEDVLRAKKQLLEVAIQAEMKALDSTTPKRAAARLKRARRAQKYLEHPERVNVVLSDSEDEAEPLASTLTATAFSMPVSQDTGEGKSSSSTKKVLFVDVDIAEATAKPMSMSQSMPELTKGSKEAPDNSAGRSGVVLPAISSALGASASSGNFGMNASIISPKSKADGFPLLSGWWYETRLWNVAVLKKGQVAKRHNPEHPGGAVVIGNGRALLFNGTHLLSPGYFYAFTINEIDETNFPLDKCKDLSMAFGFSRLPPNDKECEKPQYAYEIPGTMLVGYGSRYIDEKKWYRHVAQDIWSPKDLQVKDEVGVLLTPQGDMVVFVNGKQQLRIETSFAQDVAQSNPATPTGAKSPKSPSRAGGKSKRSLFPIIDLHGRIAAVTINARKQPPNVPLEYRNKVKAGV